MVTRREEGGNHYPRGVANYGEGKVLGRRGREGFRQTY